MSRSRQLCFAFLTLALLAGFAMPAAAQAPLVMCTLRCTNGNHSVATAVNCDPVCRTRCSTLCGVCTYGTGLDQYWCASLDSGDTAAGSALFGAAAAAPLCPAPPAPQASR